MSGNHSTTVIYSEKGKNSMQSLNTIVFALVSLIDAYSFSTILACIYFSIKISITDVSC